MDVGFADNKEFFFNKKRLAADMPPKSLPNFWGAYHF